MTTSETQARDLAEKLLLHVLQEPELLSSLMGRSGMTPDQLREIVSNPGVHEFVMDFVTESDDRVMDCADAIGVAASEIGMAARLLARRD
ncbi:DUF3572 family protein [Paracoccus albus]|uniref:DUF3572 family protein n=1 Tax=Paracoccus albus TaxID=3017784 RepID=UPI0022F02FA4|nr:DUF3572 family protein [Paracoccus albus]WBU59137.1 DUF3572 family protein [Paracoccus albus]